MKDPVREYLKRKGCPDHIVKGGLDGLIDSWETVVTEVSHGYDLTLDDYLNDMDGRQLLDEIKPLVSTAAHNALLKKLARLDAIMRTLIVRRELSLWGIGIAQEKGWTPEKNWWYFSQPAHPGPELREELVKHAL